MWTNEGLPKNDTALPLSNPLMNPLQKKLANQEISTLKFQPQIQVQK